MIVQTLPSNLYEHKQLVLADYWRRLFRVQKACFVVARISENAN